MAKAKFGMYVVDQRGKIGGTVFSKNRSGSYTRNKVTPVNRNTTTQQARRATFAGLSQQWRGLTQDQRDAWNAAAPNFPVTNIFGDQVQKSGFQLFVGFNSTLLLNGQAGITDAPSSTEVPGFAAPLLFAGSVSLGFQIEMDSAEDLPTSELWMTPGLSPGVNFAKSEFRFVQSVPASTSGPIPNVATNYANLFGSVPPEGQKVFAMVWPVNLETGQKGVPYLVQTIMIA